MGISPAQPSLLFDQNYYLLSKLNIINQYSVLLIIIIQAFYKYYYTKGFNNNLISSYLGHRVFLSPFLVFLLY